MGIGEILLKLVVAAVLGGLIGLERETHGRPAGLRTNILVCVGAALVMAVARAASSGVVDPGRAMAGVVTGIGFLGAGAIIKMGNIVRGLTTAACIWLVAALGIAVGQGLFVLAAVTTGVALFVLVVIDKLSRAIPAVTYHTVTVVSEAPDFTELSAACRERIEEKGVRVLAAEVKGDAEGRTELIYHVRVKGEAGVERLVKDLLALPHVRAASWEDFRG
ncbi:MAG: MgtC/SapB family protein [Caldiserica bacterium]|nr:MgtC/SapB family protein [Caldisericota bacterium]